MQRPISCDRSPTMPAQGEESDAEQESDDGEASDDAVDESVGLLLVSRALEVVQQRVEGEVTRAVERVGVGGAGERPHGCPERL